MIRLVLDALVKRIDRVAVVDGASLDVRPGELSVVLGPSGAGKSTLARLIAGLEKPDEGEIYFDGRPMLTVPPQDRRVGLIFQEDSLWPHFSVADNVGYGLRVRGVSRRERRQRVAEALGAARIDSLADKRPDDLSTLQRQRVALARALVTDPEVLIFDEPLGRLEPPANSDFRDDIRRIHGETQTTTIVLTNNPKEALGLGERVAVMDLGRVVQLGSPDEVYNHPADTFVAQFMGPTNLLQGQAEGTDARGEVVVRTPIGRLVGHAPGGPIDTGTPVTVSIRPESLSLGPGVPVGSNRFLATLERQVFQGEVRVVYLRAPNEWPVQAFALQSQSSGLREGQSLTVSVAPEFVIVLPSRFAAAR
jgi:ABC-type Fe3+/spermidine/putrescine transport system ATPase subunit